jgi:hypothetical protein
MVVLSYKGGLYHTPSRRYNVFLTGDYAQVPRRREVRLLDDGTREILRCAQDDKPLAVILSAAVSRPDG